MRKAATVLNFLVLLWTARNGPELMPNGLVASLAACFVLLVGFIIPFFQGWRRNHAAGSSAPEPLVGNPYQAGSTPVTLTGGPFNGQVVPAPAPGEDVVVTLGNSKVRYRADPLTGAWNYLRG